jgi:hypothetical protein
MSNLSRRLLRIWRAGAVIAAISMSTLNVPARSESGLPIQGVLESPTFMALRVPILVPNDPAAAQFFLDKLAERAFDLDRQDFMDVQLATLYSDATSLPGAEPTAPDEATKRRFEAARRLIVSGPPSAPSLTKRYLDYRSAQNENYVDWSEFQERVANELGYRVPHAYATNNAEFINDIIQKTFDLEYLKEGGLYTVAREQFADLGDVKSFWAEITARSTALLDQNISADHFFVPRFSDLVQSDSGWTTVHFSIPSGSNFGERLGPLPSGQLAEVEMDIAVLHILRPWLDPRILSRLRSLYPSKEQETNIGRISLNLFPSRVHVSFLVGRKLRALFVEKDTKPSGTIALSADSPQTSALLRSIAFSGFPNGAVFVFGLLVDGGERR